MPGLKNSTNLALNFQARPIFLQRILGLSQSYAQIGDKHRYIKSGKPGDVADNILNRQFNPDVPNQSWLSDILTSELMQVFVCGKGIGFIFSANRWLVYVMPC
ncbi:MAG: hypothetical protein ACJAYE_003555 [Candidatus Azotimanducaceae bacterium]|jgi:hypothetical protein